jgi:hypothetical protein
LNELAAEIGDFSDQLMLIIEVIYNDIGAFLMKSKLALDQLDVIAVRSGKRSCDRSCEWTNTPHAAPI